jgi:hypothetical protein
MAILMNGGIEVWHKSHKGLNRSYFACFRDKYCQS